MNVTIAVSLMGLEPSSVVVSVLARMQFSDRMVGMEGMLIPLSHTPVRKWLELETGIRIFVYSHACRPVHGQGGQWKIRI